MTSGTELNSLDEIGRKLIDISDLALERARQLGASMADVSVTQGQGLSVSVREGELETIEHHRSKGMEIRVFIDGCSGTTSCSDFTEVEIQNCVQSACNIAGYTEKDEYNGLAESEFMATEFPDLDLYHPWNMTLDDSIEVARRCESAALEFDKRITNTEGGSLNCFDGLSVYANSHGFCGITKSSRHSISCCVISGLGEKMQRDYWYDSRRAPGELSEPEAIGRKAAERTVNRIGARKLSTGEYPIVFESTIAQSLISHLISAIQGAGLYKKSSFLHDRLGQRIFPEFMHIQEHPQLVRGAGSANYDGEGVATNRNIIIDEGVLASFVLDSYTARKLGTHTTGNAGGVHNLIVNNTIDYGLDELLKAMDQGILVTELSGFGINMVTGDYSRGAFGYWVEKGQIQYPIKEFTIAGNLIDMFMGVQAIGNDIHENRNIQVGSILLDKITAAGM
ncbi:MAG: metalloprotease PmbA [Gammaproteobacteria bacterium]|nr:metalloprotease PmbA [Gammaproteobacteria bacterium]MCY4219968.1 metalloprotease PmbA [Gammaproteobacteria bacterium]MCY4273949.1 metalloprotease PmbA [Gammaproteobacteria bacterium]